MRLMKFTFAAFIALAFTSAYAFHSGGVAECEGCHSMHSPAAGGVFLLVGSDQSSACLTCHQHTGDTGPSSYHISTDPANFVAGAPLQRTPGGDFSWTKVNFATTDETGAALVLHGGGHRIVAADFGYTGATGNSPGGAFPAANLACNSCHDPHGKYRRNTDGTISNGGAAIWASGSYPGASNEPKVQNGESLAVGVYRLLAGAGYTKSGVTFNGVPAAKAPSTYNQSEATNQVRVAYGVATTGGHETWGQWCATCHGAMHSTGNYVHPVDQALGSTIIGNYNSYRKSGDMSGVAASSYLSLTPFFQNTNSYTTLGTNALNNAPTYAGPSDGDQVACLSCHRAHASGFAEMLRFDNGYEFTVKNGAYVGQDNTTGTRAGLQARGRTAAQWQAAYYDRPATMWSQYQRVLCNKCHAKD